MVSEREAATSTLRLSRKPDLPPPGGRVDAPKQHSWWTSSELAGKLSRILAHTLDGGRAVASGHVLRRSLDFRFGSGDCWNPQLVSVSLAKKQGLDFNAATRVVPWLKSRIRPWPPTDFECRSAIDARRI